MQRDTGAAPAGPHLCVAPPRNVLCLGKNYRAHATEFARFAHDKDVVPEVPIVFTKPTSSLCGHTDEVAVDPDLAKALDYEVELGVVIGRGGAWISEERAEEHVFGYTVVNDITARDLQRQHKQFFLGKSLYRATPVGPVVVPRDRLTGLLRRGIRSWVNDEIRQEAVLGDMVFGVPATIAAISKVTPLEPGDLIAMGTPGGVAVGFTPPRYLRDGDRVICEIDGIGRLDNVVRFRRPAV